MDNRNELKKFVLRESTREGGNIEKAHELNRMANLEKIKDEIKKSPPERK